MSLRPHWLRPPRRLLLLVVGIVLGAAAALGWLGWRLLEQDRALESQHIQERLDAAADLVGAALVRKLAEQDDQLTGRLTMAAATPAPRNPQPAETTNALAVTFDAYSVVVSPRSAVRYYPFGPADDEASANVVAPGDVFEFQLGDRAKAIAAFRAQAHSPDPTIKAAALLGVARNLHKNGQTASALAAYADLAVVGPIPIAGVPADLLARHARCVLFEEAKDVTTLEREASALYADLQGGRWQLAHGAYLFHAADARRWSAPAPDLRAREEDAIALSGGVDWLWSEWQRVRDGNEPPAGRRSLWINEQPVLVLWRSTQPGRLVASVVGRNALDAEWSSALAPVAARQAARVAVIDTDGHVVLGQGLGSDAATRHVIGRFAGMQLPWTVQVSSADPAADLAMLGGRRRLFFGGFVLTALLLATGGYFTARAVSRELAVARLQSDFVAAVSHEFRTPLATMRQLSELLADGRVANDEHRQEYYEGLRGESERLSRLVEDLLDFGRMDAGAREYRFQSVEPGALVKTVADEFAARVQALGYHVDVAIAPPLPDVRGDREALGRALWNLLDNAVKYSPESKTIWVEAVREGEQVAIRVRDKGVGIAGDEQRKIFKKFVRTSSAKAAGIKGTGLGLAMVEHIVSAHGGEVRVNSTPGAGSAFTILLPVSGDAS